MLPAFDHDCMHSCSLAILRPLLHTRQDRRKGFSRKSRRNASHAPSDHKAQPKMPPDMASSEGCGPQPRRGWNRPAPLALPLDSTAEPGVPVTKSRGSSYAKVPPAEIFLSASSRLRKYNDHVRNDANRSRLPSGTDIPCGTLRSHGSRPAASRSFKDFGFNLPGPSS